MGDWPGVLWTKLCDLVVVKMVEKGGRGLTSLAKRKAWGRGPSGVPDLLQLSAIVTRGGGALSLDSGGRVCTKP